MQHLIDKINILVEEFFPLLRYGETCYVRFVNPKYFKPKLATNRDANPIDTSNESVIDLVITRFLTNQDEIRNSVEIYYVYIENDGHQHL